jgi:hypothetical protein
MPPFGRSKSLRARGYAFPPTSLNVPVIGLVLAFAMLLLVCIGICCCSYRKTAKRNKRYQQRRRRGDRDWVGFTQLNSPFMNNLSGERHDAAETKAAHWPGVGEPPAYSTVNSAMLASPQIPQSESERLLPPTPIDPRAPSPPPPTYNAVR